ncbi:Protein of unknown function [Belliella buryatensis]|uniref:DUF4256 domain-containing protein n=1 Tax=Belliella buryatensis TaxID=1500549 RepID=A0A239GLT0_9BACT|nr:DUF4256 domain-containing protein [Belliella buryatensis]SNS69772.1 Protein of unknown function [Belliella buryatensis]
MNKENLLETLKERFENNMQRHPDYKWQHVLSKFSKNPQAYKTIQQMESTGGEPDVIGIDHESGKFIYCDCSIESPLGRRSLCYDQEAWEKRKANKPSGTAKGMAKDFGIQLLTEEMYFHLQTLGDFDLKTSSWLETPDSIRKKGGAIFGDKRFGRTFIYHNGADSYYGARGFRGYFLL